MSAVVTLTGRVTMGQESAEVPIATVPLPLGPGPNPGFIYPGEPQARLRYSSMIKAYFINRLTF